MLSHMLEQRFLALVAARPAHARSRRPASSATPRMVGHFDVAYPEAGAVLSEPNRAPGSDQPIKGNPFDSFPNLDALARRLPVPVEAIDFDTHDTSARISLTLLSAPLCRLGM